MLHQLNSVTGRQVKRLLIVMILIVMLVSPALGAVRAQDQVSSEGCVFTPELLDGQGFSLSGLGFSLSGLGFSVSGLGFSLSGLGFSLSGLGVSPEEVVAEIIDEDNRVDSQWLIDRVPDIEGGDGFDTTDVALIVVDDYAGNPANSAASSPDDPHGKKVKEVADMIIADLLAAGVISDSQIAVFPLDVSDAGEGYRADVIATRLDELIGSLETQGYKHFVINLSFGVLPCQSEVELGDGTIVPFDFDDALEAIEDANTPQPVVNYLECVSDYPGDLAMAHFGFDNPNGSPVIVPAGDDNHLMGGGLSDSVLSAVTPTYFGRPNVVDGEPGRSAPFPNSAFQVVFDPDYPLEWTLFGKTVTASADSPKCIVPNGYGILQYLAETYGLSPDQINEVIDALLQQVQDDPAAPLAELQTLLRNLLQRSANEDDFAAFAVASSGNFRFLFPRSNPENPLEPLPFAPPLSPAALPETIATSALLGPTIVPAGGVSPDNRDLLWRFSHDGNTAVPGGVFELGENNLMVGTSFAAPMNSVLAALWLTYPDACTFETPNRPPLDLEVAGDFVNALYQIGGHDYPLTCERNIVLEVPLDIKPGNDNNTLNLGSEGTLTAAILGSPDFDAAFVDPTTVTLAEAPIRAIGKKKLDYKFRDVNGDGRVDLEFKVNTAEMMIPYNMVEAVMEAELLDGTRIRGVDVLRIVPTGSVTLTGVANGGTSSSSIVTLTWEPTMGGVCYQIEIDDNADFSSPVQQATVVDGEQYTSWSLADGTYYWRVQAGGDCNDVEPGPWSATWSFTVVTS